MATIDLTNRIIQPQPAVQPSRVRWHPWRRLVQVLCGTIVVILPITNGLRVDLRSDLFYFAWHKIAVSNAILIFWIGMLALWALVAVSYLYGRLWCGWVCPQTLASDYAESLKRRLDRAFRARPGRPSYIASRSIWSVVVVVSSIAAGAVMTSYWLAPSAVGAATIVPWTDTTAAATVYIIAAVLAADMLWLRRRFCSHACPYGAFLGVLADKNTLAVRYLDERDSDCIRCGKCVTDCPMGIDIKQGVGQYACIGCGECVDACNDVLGNRGVLGLIEYRYGLEPERTNRSLTPMQRLGLWDKRRWGVLVALVGFVAAIGLTMFARFPLCASAMANGVVSRTAGLISDTYTLTVSNGDPERQTYRVSVVGLPGGVVESPSLAVVIDGHSQKSFSLTLVAPASAAAPGQGRQVSVLVQSSDAKSSGPATVPLIFYSPHE